MSVGYELVQVQTTEDWQTYHLIRREELFNAAGQLYDAHRPEEQAPDRYPLLLRWKGKGIATTRLDVHARGMAIVRLVAVAHVHQGEGHGRVLANMVEAFARTKGATKLYLNARPSAVGFYERLGYSFEDWDPAELTGTRDRCRQMSKVLL